MSADLTAGKGRCHGTALLLVRPVQAAIELGAGGDVVAKVLNAVHHANRHGNEDDFVAVALPGMQMTRIGMVAGHDVTMFGSEESLAAVLNLDGIKLLQRRGMVRDLVTEEAWCDAGSTGSAWVRDRTCEKYTAGWLRRSQARAARRGKPLGKLSPTRGVPTDLLTLTYGTTPVHLREVIGTVSGVPLMVSTYGFSSPGAAAVLPVQSLMAERRNADAA